MIYEVTEEWDVPLMPTRGYASLSFLHSAAMAIAQQGKPAFLYYLGDFDPSGVDIPRAVLRELHRQVPHVDITFPHRFFVRSSGKRSSPMSTPTDCGRSSA